MLPDSISKILRSKRAVRLKQATVVRPTFVGSKQSGAPRARKLQRITQPQTRSLASIAYEPLSSEVIMSSAEFEPGLTDNHPPNSNPNSNNPVENAQWGQTFSQAEKLELLSAYLDDEVSEEEKHLVAHWLACDVQLQKHYQNQLKLRQAIRCLGSGVFSAAADSDSVTQLETDTELDEFPVKECSLQEVSLNVFSPLRLLGNRSLGYKLNSQLAISDALAQTSAQAPRWKRGLLVIIAALGATVVTLFSNAQIERRRPAHLNRFRELSSPSLQRHILKGQLP